MSSESFIRVGPAPAGSILFVKRDGRVVMDGQGGRPFDYGHSFDSDRGYRVFFNFKDAPETRNTWGPQSLLDWCDAPEPTTNPEVIRFLEIARQQARQCLALNREWERLGRPVSGIPTDAKGNA